jgi:hypothetical protein
MARAVQHLSCKGKVLSSNPTAAKKNVFKTSQLKRLPEHNVLSCLSMCLRVLANIPPNRAALDFPAHLGSPPALD